MPSPPPSGAGAGAVSDSSSSSTSSRSQLLALLQASPSWYRALSTFLVNKGYLRQPLPPLSLSWLVNFYYQAIPAMDGKPKERSLWGIVAAAFVVLLIVPAFTILISTFVDNSDETKAVARAAWRKTKPKEIAYAAVTAVRDMVTTPLALARALRDAYAGTGIDGAALDVARRLARAVWTDASTFPGALRDASREAAAYLRAVASRYPLTFVAHALLDALDDLVRVPDVLAAQAWSLLHAAQSPELESLFVDIFLGPARPQKPHVDSLDRYVAYERDQESRLAAARQAEFDQRPIPESATTYADRPDV